MCDTLVELRGAVSRYAAGFDVALLSGPQAEAVLEAATAIERMAGVIKTKAAARGAEVRSWKVAGERSAASHLARRQGSTVGQAADAIATAKRLENLPALDAAARSGELSAAQTAAIADAASADPSAEARLVAKAKSASLAELREECARTKATACADLEARRHEIHERRSLRGWTTRTVCGTCTCVTIPRWGRSSWPPCCRCETGCSTRPEPMDGVSAWRPTPPTPWWRRCARRRPRRRPATTTGLLAPASGRVDLPALLRGYPVEGEMCEIAGFGPVAVSAIRDLIDTADPFLAAVVTAGEAVVGVAHLGRRPRATQRTALEWLYPMCAVEGCSATTFLETDHRVAWAESHLTVFDLLDRLCRHHHDRKTLDGWALVEGRGKRAFVPPDDPRHPRHAGRTHDPPAAA